MKFTDFGKKGMPKYEAKNPKVIIGRDNYYDIEYDAVYENGHIENHTGFGSYYIDVIKEYLKNYFEIDDNKIEILTRNAQYKI